MPPLRLRGRRRATPWSGGWRTSRSGGDRRRCWSRSAATGAPAAGTCGAKTPAEAAEPRAKLSRRGLRWALEGDRGPAPDRRPGRRRRSAVSWNTANDAVLAEGKRVLIDDPHRFDGVTVDRRRRARLAAHPPRRQVRHRDHRPHRRSATAPARPGCWTWSRAAPSRRSRPGSPTGPQAWRDGVEVVAMDGFTGFKTATAEELPDAVAVMDPFHVVRLAGDALDRCRRRVQQDHPRPPRPQRRPALPRPADPAHRRRPAHRQADAQRLDALFAGDDHVEVEATWGDLPAHDRRLPRTRPAPRPAS